MNTRIKTIVLATTNNGKIAELTEILNPLNINVIGLNTFQGYPEVEETGATFAENALIKAHAAARYTGLIAIADDSGLTVNALNGAPGIYSARYGDDIPYIDGETRDDRNIRKLLNAMNDIPQGNRACQFNCVMAAAHPTGKELCVLGQWHGELLTERRGTNGFGYDPIFYDATLGKTAAELTREEKSAVSHRGKAMHKLMTLWHQWLNDCSK